MITLQDFEALVPDKGIRDYITCAIDEDNLFSDVANFVPLYQNIINLAFMYAFSCYLDLKNNSRNGTSVNLEECNKKGNANSQRVIRTMQHIYSRYPLSTELMQFVLSDIYYDFIQGENACLKRYMPNCVSQGDYWCDKGVGLNDYFAFVNEHAESSRVDKDLVGADFTLDSASKYLRSLIGFFPFLSKTSLYYDSTAGWYVFGINDYAGNLFRNGVIDTFDLVRKFGGKEKYFCFLSEIEKDILRYETPRLNRFICCPMVGVDGEGSYAKDNESIKKPFHIPTDYETVMSYFSAYDKSLNGAKKAPSITMDQLFNINYKYMKNLALSIADVIGKKHNQSAAKRITEIFSSKYPHAFASYNEEDKNWDNIIIILLIEAGPSMVLNKFLFFLDDAGDDELVRNIQRRFKGRLSGVLSNPESGDEFTDLAMSLLGDRYVKNAKSPELIEYNKELVTKAKTQLILSAIAEAEQSDDSLELKLDRLHTDDIQQQIILLKAAENDISSKKCELVKKSLGDTLRRLICFYSGIFEYGKERIKYENASRKRLLRVPEIREAQQRAEQAFLARARQRAAEIKSISSATELLKEFIRLCDNCYRSEISVAQKRSVESKQLYAALGKNFIMDRSAFEQIIETDKIVDICEENAEWWRVCAIEILSFFSFGSCTDKGTARLYGAIAPVVASYNNRNNSRDGYDTATFALIFDANEINGKGMEINLLSEFSYEISMRYYCLPNVVRSNDKWWIDPFIIKCSDFDAIFFER